MLDNLVHNSSSSELKDTHTEMIVGDINKNMLEVGQRRANRLGLQESMCIQLLISLFWNIAYWSLKSINLSQVLDKIEYLSFYVNLWLSYSCHSHTYFVLLAHRISMGANRRRGTPFRRQFIGFVHHLFWHPKHYSYR